MAGARDGVKSVVQVSLLAVTALVTFPATVAAECDPRGSSGWPSFRATSPDAASVVVGEVTAPLAVGQGGLVTRFRLRVDEVPRGQAPSSIEFQVPFEAPDAVCTVGPLSVDVGDRLALALNSSDMVDPAVVAVALISDPSGSAGPWAPDRLTLPEVRVIAAQPRSPWPLLALAGAILAVFLIRPSWRRPTRPGLAAVGR